MAVLPVQLSKCMILKKTTKMIRILRNRLRGFCLSYALLREAQQSFHSLAMSHWYWKKKQKWKQKKREKKTTNHFISWKIVTGSIWCYLGSVAKQRNKVIECFAWKQRLKFICPLSWALQSLLSHWDMNFFFFVSCQSFDPAETEEFVLKWEADVERGKTKWSNMSLSEWFHKI